MSTPLGLPLCHIRNPHRHRGDLSKGHQKTLSPLSTDPSWPLSLCLSEETGRQWAASEGEGESRTPVNPLPGMGPCTPTGGAQQTLCSGGMRHAVPQ